jgi:hypothetical protein
MGQYASMEEAAVGFWADCRQTLTLPDYGRVARHSGSNLRNRLQQTSRGTNVSANVATAPHNRVAWSCERAVHQGAPPMSHALSSRLRWCLIQRGSKLCVKAAVLGVSADR